LKFFPNRKPEEVKTRRICLYCHLGQCTGPCDNLITKQEYRKSIIGSIRTLEGKKTDHLKDMERQMKKYSRNEKYEAAAVLRDKIADLQYLSQRIDISAGDTEHEFEEIRQSRDLAGIHEVIKKLMINYPEMLAKRFRIECYDISNLSGNQAYGSMSVTIGTQPHPELYRIFKIKQPGKPDDPKMLREVLQRRIRYITDKSKQTGVRNQNESLLSRPNLILIDGGKGQLSSIFDQIPDGIGFLAISKGKHLKRAGQKQVDEFWAIQNGKFRQLKIDNPYILQVVRDEAHRFAIKHHRNARKFNQKKSVLDEIPGIGPKRKKDLIQKFKSVTNIKKANLDELTEVLKNRKTAENLLKQIGD
jgi:excinuclease UvrABC nuclease subunit